jgi:hypothetical protein
MNDHHTTTLDHYQGLVDQLADEDAALDTYRTEFSEKLMQEYTDPPFGALRITGSTQHARL